MHGQTFCVVVKEDVIRFVTFPFPFNYFQFIHLKVQHKDVEIVIMDDTLLNYSCQITEYNYNIMII